MLNKNDNFTTDWNYTRRRKFEQLKDSALLAVCDNCLAFYYEDSWHEEHPKNLSIYYEEEIPIFFTQCFTCLEEEEALYERESELIFGY